MGVCQSQSPNSFQPPSFSLWFSYSCSPHLRLYFCFVNKIISTSFFRFHYICVNIQCMFFSSWLHSLWQFLGPSAALLLLEKVESYCLIESSRKTYTRLLLLLSHFSRVRLFLILWTVAYQAPLCMGFSRQEYWSGPTPGDLPDPVIKPLIPPALAGRFFTISTTWEAQHIHYHM